MAPVVSHFLRATEAFFLRSCGGPVLDGHGFLRSHGGHSGRPLPEGHGGPLPEELMESGVGRTEALPPHPDSSLPAGPPGPALCPELGAGMPSSPLAGNLCPKENPSCSWSEPPLILWLRMRLALGRQRGFLGCCSLLPSGWG